MVEPAHKILSGQTERIATINPHPGLAIFAKFTVLAVFVFLVLTSIAGSHKAQLADPSWPLPNKELFGENWLGGLKYEYLRRIAGLISAVSVILLTIITFALENRAWVKKLAGALMAVMALEFISGGIIIKTVGNPYIFMIHGIILQVFLAITVLFSYSVSKRWMRDAGIPVIVNPHNNGFLKFLNFLLFAVFLQIVFGNGVRYGLDSFLPFLFAHITGALLVIAVIVWFAMRALMEYKDVDFLVKPAKIMLAIIGIQLLLGIFAIFSNRARIEPEVMRNHFVGISLFHVICASVLLIVALLTTVRAYRLLAKNDDFSGVTGSHRVKEVVA